MKSQELLIVKIFYFKYQYEKINHYKARKADG